MTNTKGTRTRQNPQIPLKKMRFFGFTLIFSTLSAVYAHDKYDTENHGSVYGVPVDPNQEIKNLVHIDETLKCYNNRPIVVWWPNMCDSLASLQSNNSYVNDCKHLIIIGIDPRFTVPQTLRKVATIDSSIPSRKRIAQSLRTYSRTLTAIATNYNRGLHEITNDCDGNVLPIQSYGHDQLNEIVTHYNPEAIVVNIIVKNIQKSILNPDSTKLVDFLSKRDTISTFCTNVAIPDFCQNIVPNDDVSTCRCKKAYDCSSPKIRKCLVSALGSIINGVLVNDAVYSQKNSNYSPASACKHDFIASANDCPTLLSDNLSSFNSF